MSFLIHVFAATSVAIAQTKHAEQVRAGLETAARAIQEDRPADALAAIESIEPVEPNNPWVGFYRGLAHLKLGNWYESMAGFDRARDLLTTHGNPDPLLLQAIREYRRQARNQVFGISYQAGLIYDGNVTFLGSGGAGFEIAGRGDAKFSSRLHIAYAPIADERETVAFGLRVMDSWHFSIEEFNDQEYGTTLRYRWRLGERWEAAVQYDYDISYLGNEPFLSRHVITPGVAYEWPRWDVRFRPFKTSLYYRIESHDYLFDTEPAFDRDGFVNGVGVDQSFKFRPVAGDAWTWDVYAGYFFEAVATEGSEFDRLDHTFNLGVAVPLTNPWLPDKELTFRFNAAWQIADYRRDSLIDADGDERADLITALDAVISQKLVKDPERGDVTLHAVVGWSDADSNVTLRGGAQPFTYDKWVAGFQLEWSW